MRGQSDMISIALRLLGLLGVAEITAWLINTRIFGVPKVHHVILLTASGLVFVSGISAWVFSRPSPWGEAAGGSLFLIFLAWEYRLRRARANLGYSLPLKGGGEQALRSRRLSNHGGAEGEGTPPNFRVSRESVPGPRLGRRWNDAGDLQLTRVRVSHALFPPGLPSVSFLYLSDIHVGSYAPREFWERIAAAVRSIEAPLVFGGDLISHIRNLPRAEAFLKTLDGVRKGWAVLGNHDHWTDAEAVSGVLKARGFDLLRDQSRPWPGSPGVGVYGSDDFSTPRRELPRAEYPVTILFCHTPDRLFEAAEKGYAAAFCGHTHGGQIHLPLFRELAIPSSFDRLFTSGAYSLGPTRMWIGQGLGGPPFYRWGPKPEVLLHTVGGLESKAE